MMRVAQDHDAHVRIKSTPPYGKINIGVCTDRMYQALFLPLLLKGPGHEAKPGVVATYESEVKQYGFALLP